MFKHDLWLQWSKTAMEKPLWHQCNIPHGLQPQWKTYGFMKDPLSKVVMVKDNNVMVKDKINAV